MKAFICLTMSAATLAGCAMVDDKARMLLASRAPAYAVVNGVLYEGQAKIFNNRTGIVQLAAQNAPDQLCSGTMHYTATVNGEWVLHCAGGVDTAVTFVALREVRGYGYGATEQGPVSFTWGFTPQDAAAYLHLPPGQRPFDPDAAAAMATPASAPTASTSPMVAPVVSAPAP